MARLFLHPLHPSIKYVANDDGTYMSEEQIAQDLLESGEIKYLDIEYFRSKPVDDFTTDFRLTLGMMWLRNQYGLWHLDNPHTDCSTKYTHPESMSDRVMRRFHRLIVEGHNGSNFVSLTDVTF